MKTTSNKLKLILILLTISVFILIYFISSSILNLNTNKKNTIETTQSTLSNSKTITLSNGIKLDFVLINPGSFTMGSNEEFGDGDEGPKHKVTITEAFYLGKFEVTQEQWLELMGSNPSEFVDLKKPVDNVSWDDCKTFLQKLAEKTGENFSLPTEAQWEYACRAGTDSLWTFGDTAEEIGNYAWLDINSAGTTHEVGTKKPNPWGLYDMYGNIQEWCEDLYTDKYSETDTTDPIGPSSGDSRVIRGGAWGDISDSVRSSYRNCSGATNKTNGTGFRCVLIID